MFIVGSQFRVVDCVLRLGVIKGNGTRDNPDPRPRIWGCYMLSHQGLVYQDIEYGVKTSFRT